MINGRDLPSPYPPDPEAKITWVKFLDDLHFKRHVKAIGIEAGREAEYVVSQDYRVQYTQEGDSRVREITVPEGMLTDFASVPRMARWFAGRVGPHLEAAIVHDWLFVAWQELGIQPQRQHFRFANAIFAALLKAAGVGWFKRMIMIRAVSGLIGWRVFRKPEDRRFA
ncbi:MAG: DUF1353 domain-containing protein [Pseudomonadota bacterium]